MICDHVRDRLFHRSETRCREGTGLFHPGDVGKQNLLFFEHVSRKFLADRLKEFFNPYDFTSIRPVLRHDLGEQSFDPRRFPSDVAVMVLDDVGYQLA